MGDDDKPKKKAKGERIAILDAGTPYAKRLDRAARELNIETQVIPLETPAPSLKARNYKALLIAGGNGAIDAFDSPWYDSGMFQLGIPCLGVNYGMSMLVKSFGGSVQAKGGRQTEDVDVSIDDTCPLFKGCKATERVLLTHGESVKSVGTLKAVAHFRKEVVGVADVGKNLYGLRFHPESILTAKGGKMMENFLVQIAKCKAGFNVNTREQRTMERVAFQAGQNPVLMLCSGGLDSTVAAMLLKGTIGNQNLFCICIETGFEKKGMLDKTSETLKEIGVNFRIVPAVTRFIAAQTTVPNRQDPKMRRRETKAMVDQTEPEDKRLICKDTLCKIAEEFMVEKYGTTNDVFLGLGTTRSDVIDLGLHLPHHAAKISKQHITQVDIIRRFRHEDRLIEPCAEFHKREIVQLAKKLQAPPDVIREHPFPSEIGLALRIVAMHIVHVGRHFAETQVLCKAITEFHKMKSDHALMNLVDAALDDDDRKELKAIAARTSFKATVMPLEVVGMHGSKKTYYYACALSDNRDFGVKWPEIFYIAKMITKVVHDVNRVAYAFGGRISYIVRDVTPTYMTMGMYDMVREADEIVHNILKEKGVYGKIDQMPVVVVPIHFDRTLLSMDPSCRRSIVLRPFKSTTLMSGVAAMPGKDIPNDALKQMVSTLRLLPGVSRVLYDVTSKPPAHVEWQ